MESSRNVHTERDCVTSPLFLNAVSLCEIRKVGAAQVTQLPRLSSKVSAIILQHLLKPFPRGVFAVERNRSRKLSRLHLSGSFTNARKHSVLILREVAQFVNQINEEKLRRDLLRYVQSTLESDQSIVERKCSMPLLGVDNAFVVELCRPKSQLVVGIRGGQDKTVGLQERLHQLVLLRGSLSKFKFARAVVQARSELLEGPVD